MEARPEGASPTGTRRWSLAWLLPLFVVPLAAARAAEPIRDNGFLWHIRAGTAQTDLGSVLTRDPFSFTELGSPWLTQSWLLELLYGWLEGRFPSLAWANWFVFACTVVTMVAVGLAAVRRNRSPIVVTAALVVFVWLLAPFAQPRPVIASYALLGLVVVAVAHRERLAWTIPVIVWVFAAVHGSWIIALGIVVLEAIRAKDCRLAKAAAAGAALSLMTAHGLGTWQIVLDFAQASDSLDYIIEWMPPDFANIAQAPYLLIVAALLIAAARGGMQTRDLVVVIPFLLFGLTAQRTVVPAAIVLVPWAVTSVPPVRSRVTVHRSVGVVAAALVVALGVAPMLARPLGVLADGRFPEQRLTESLPERGVFHDSLVGGFLIYDRWPDTLVYIDDRAELYDAAHFEGFQRAIEGDYRDEFDRWSIDTVLVESGVPLVRQLVTDGWRIVDRGSSFTLLRTVE